MSEHDISKMKVADLKRELKLRGLFTTGNKIELQDRLQTALLEGDISLEDTAISAEDLLGEDDVLTDEEEKAILVIPTRGENELLKSPSPLSAEISLKDSLPQSNDNLVNTSSASTLNQSLPKKVVLKRKNSFTTSTLTSVGSALLHISKENTEPSQKVIKKSETNTVTAVTSTEYAKVSDSKVVGVKISQLTLQERLEMRAKKFGLTGCADATGKGTVTSASNGKQIETLKRRAERFGCIVSPTIAQIDANEKLLRRKERFGDVETNKETKNNVDAYAEKARMRLKRFNAPSAEGNFATTATK